MSARIACFDPIEGGLSLNEMVYENPADAASGKSEPVTDMVNCRFAAIEEDRKIVQEIEFTSDDPAFAGTMRMIWSLAPRDGGTEVTFLCEDVPHGISPEDHATGLQSTLENLAVFAQQRRSLPIDARWGDPTPL